MVHVIADIYVLHVQFSKQAYFSSFSAGLQN